jgi:FtsP/CotA-like multicopper oxidase with cupredoxin domain
MSSTKSPPAGFDWRRRRLVQGIGVGLAAGVCGLAPRFGQADPGAEFTASAVASATPRELRGTQFDLTIAETPVNFTGHPRLATTINGALPAPTLRWREGDTVTLRVHNRLAEESSIHWHGILLPYQMDGVPGISFPGIPPGGTFTYRFKVAQSGTYWYHSHSGMQEQRGLYGAIIIDPIEGERIQADRDLVLLLSDWSDEEPMQLLKRLKVQSDYYNFNQPTLADFVRDLSSAGWSAAIERRQMWQQMRMNPTDLADISAHTYRYLINGMTPADNWTGLFRPGERLRLRLINGSAMTFYDLRIPGLPLTVVQVDGQNVEPVTVDELRFGPGETYDVIVAPRDDVYTLFAQSMDRSGFARATLATRPGLTAPVPALDPVEWLSMTDMMGDMHGGRPAHHARSEHGPGTDMRVDRARSNLDDPGVGLRNNGRRVLTLADLHSLEGVLDRRMADREIELHLTGNMERYSWSFDGVEYGQSTPVHFRHGERLRVILHNDTMMTHPMHLHGMWSELESPAGAVQLRRHTFAVQPAQRISFLVTADALGRWAWHCHLMFHMDSGMFREVVVA